MQTVYRRLIMSLILAASSGLFAGCSLLGPKAEPMETGLSNLSFVSPVTGESREFALWTPKDYNDSRRAWPVIVFLHGAGERGDDPTLLIKHGPIKEAMLRGDLPFLIIAPQCPRPAPGEGNLSANWSAYAPDALAALDRVREDYRVDETRLYLTGLSLGGFGSFSLAADEPGLFAAVAPICGGGEAQRVHDYRGTPFWVFHGLKDRVVPPNRSIEMVEAMKAVGCDVKLTTYPEKNHDSWTVTYENDELYSWFLAHERASE